MIVRALTASVYVDNVSRQRYGDVGVCKSPYLVKRRICDAQNGILKHILMQFKSDKSVKVLIELNDQDIMWLKEIVIMGIRKGRNYRLFIDLTKDFMYEIFTDMLKTGVADVDPRMYDLYAGMWYRYYRTNIL